MERTMSLLSDIVVYIGFFIVVILLAAVLAGCGSARAQEKAPATPVVKQFRMINLDDYHDLTITRTPSGRYLVCSEAWGTNGGVGISCDWDGLHNDLYTSEGKIK